MFKPLVNPPKEGEIPQDIQTALSDYANIIREPTLPNRGENNPLTSNTVDVKESENINDNNPQEEARKVLEEEGYEFTESYWFSTSQLSEYLTELAKRLNKPKEQ